VIITWFGEIMPQAYFARHPLKTASLLSPVIRFYQYLLYPVARPTGRFLDWWIGREAIEYMQEPLLRDILRAHVLWSRTDVSEVEGLGALNFLDIDDLTTLEEGEDVAPESIVEVPVRDGRPCFPAIERRADDPFLQAINRTLHTWVILVDAAGEPLLALNVSEFTRAALYGERHGERAFDPFEHCHRPIVVRDHTTTLGDVIRRLKRRVAVEGAQPDAVIENDVVLIWLDRPRIITGSDILGRLLTGIGSR
jgi:metal transporter CNNM